MQLDGFTVVAEYGSRFEADLAANRLVVEGFHATVLSDAAHQVAPHIVTQRGHRLLVIDGESDRASTALAQAMQASAEAAATPAPVGLGRRPRWFRWLAYSLVVAFIVPVVGGAVQLLINIFG